ncbi:hypothetical protein GN956_G7149 [Arapaima gigas]
MTDAHVSREGDGSRSREATPPSPVVRSTPSHVLLQGVVRSCGRASQSSITENAVEVQELGSFQPLRLAVSGAPRALRRSWILKRPCRMKVLVPWLRPVEMEKRTHECRDTDKRTTRLRASARSNMTPGEDWSNASSDDDLENYFGFSRTVVTRMTSQETSQAMPPSSSSSGTFFPAGGCRQWTKDAPAGCTISISVSTSGAAPDSQEEVMNQTLSPGSSEANAPFQACHPLGLSSSGPQPSALPYPRSSESWWLTFTLRNSFELQPRRLGGSKAALIRTWFRAPTMHQETRLPRRDRSWTETTEALIINGPPWIPGLIGAFEYEMDPLGMETAPSSQKSPADSQERGPLAGRPRGRGTFWNRD